MFEQSQTEWVIAYVHFTFDLHTVHTLPVKQLVTVRTFAVASAYLGTETNCHKNYVKGSVLYIVLINKKFSRLYNMLRCNGR